MALKWLDARRLFAAQRVWLLAWTWLASVSAASAEDVTAVWAVGDNIPERLATVIRAELSAATNSVSFVVDDRRLSPDPVTAQRESGESTVWLPVELPSEFDGQEALQIAMRPVVAADTITIHPTSRGYAFRDSGRPVLVYQSETQQQSGVRRSNYVHPVLDFEGRELTEAFPHDHLHHQGVFWAWHQLRVDGRRIGDPWLTEDFLVQVEDVRVIEEGPLFATLQVSAYWTSPLLVGAKGRHLKIVRERTTIRLFRRQGDWQYVDFEIRLTPLMAAVEIGGAENERGYSGFTVRVKPPADMRIHDGLGRLQEDRVGGQSRWADVSGRFGNDESVSGIAILSHPTLPQFPPRWLLRFYGMQNVVFPGRERILLSSESPLILRHRLVIHSDDHLTARIADHQRVYEGKAGD